jgi:hypothetical protein
MAELYIYLLLGICVGLIGWGLARPERVYQYPFFMGASFVTFILPQAIALINKPGAASIQAIERVFMMTCLCAAMCWLGYQVPININFLKNLDIPVKSEKLFHGGIVFVLIAQFFSFLLSRLPSDAAGQVQLTGIATIYVFFTSLIFPGFTIFLLSALRQPKFWTIAATSFAATIPLQMIIFGGRREPTAAFIITIGLCFYFLRRYVPPRSIIIAGIVGALLSIIMIGAYRNIAATGNWNQLFQLRPIESFQTFIEEGEILELRNAALLMDATVKTGKYGYGTGYWDMLVFRYIPAQLVGKDLKNSLQFNLSFYDLKILFNYPTPPEYSLKTLYGYSIPIGTTSTGMADSFSQFDYLGCLFFAFLAYLFKTLWFSAVYRQSVISQIFYISLISSAIKCVTHGTEGFLPDLFFYSIFVGVVIIYSRYRTRICASSLRQYHTDKLEH